jgi:hypothetical protein
MANLTRTFRWERLVPDLGDNKEQPKPFYLEVASGLSILERQDVGTALQAAFVELQDDFTTDAYAVKAASALSGVVRLGAEPLTVAGVPVATLEEYFKLVLPFPGSPNWFEVVRALTDFNSADGSKALFFARHSGGPVGIPAPSAAKAANQTVSQ